jgi:hypothetical protein
LDRRRSDDPVGFGRNGGNNFDLIIVFIVLFDVVQIRSRTQVDVNDWWGR